jgi:hypothetical protein
LESTVSLRQGRLVWHYDFTHDVVTLSYVGLVLESDADVAWFEQECEAFWKRFHGATPNPPRKDLLVDMNGIIVKPAVAAAWNAIRAKMAGKYIAKTYRFNGNDRRTVTAVHLGQVLNNTDGTIYPDQQHALAALFADRAAARA